MKKSDFNIFIEKKNGVLCFNSLTNSYLLIPHKVYGHFRNESVESFQIEYPKFYENFKESGFIIDNELSELGNIRLDNKLKIFNSKDYFLMIYPTQDCNLKCWYCYENHVPQSFMTKDVQTRIVNHIKSVVVKKELNFINITFFGGEPLLNHDTIVFPLLEEIKKICDNANVNFYCFFITNGTLLTEEVILRLKKFNPMFQITLDGNSEKHNKVRAYKTDSNGSFDAIVNALKLISKHLLLTNSYVASIATIRINYDNATLREIDKLIEEIKDLDKSKFVVHLERVWQTKGLVNDEQTNLLKDAVRKFASIGFRVGHGVFGRKSYSCPAEICNYAIINYDGLVYKCNGRNLEKDKAEGVLLEDGNIQWKSSFIVKRSSVSTFENEKCLNCKMLPQCMGPCSQKQIEHGWGNVDKICSLNAIDIPLNDYLTLDFETKYIIDQSRKERSTNV